jgi:hypothetical protein
MGIEDYIADKGKAALALLDWLNSQNITVTNSVPVLAIAMASIIQDIAKTRDMPTKEVLSNAIEMIEGLVEDMEEHDEPE